MTAVIAFRQFRWRNPDGTEATVEVRVGTPAFLAEQEVAECYCPYQIRRFKREPDKENPEELLVESVAYGIDTVQALYLALYLAGSELGTLAGSPHPDCAHEPNFGFPTQP